MAVEERLPFGELTEESLVDVFGRQRRSQRQIARGEAFREAEEIGDDTFEFRDCERPQAPEAREDLVEDQVHAVLAAKVSHRLHEPSGLLGHARGALDARLQDDAGRRGGVAFEEGLQRGQRGGGVGPGHLAGAFGMDRCGESLGGEEPGIEAAMELRAFADGHRAEGVAVVGAFHRDDPAFGFLADELPILERELQGDLHGVATVVGVEAAGERAVRQAGEVFGEFRRDRVVQAKERHMGDLLGLLAEGAIQVGVVVAMDVRPDRGVAVEVALPFPVDQPAALAADQVQARIVLILPHLGKRMPPEAPVGGIEGVRRGRSGCGGSRHTPYLGPMGPLLSQK